METETGIQCIQMYTASALKYTVYKMYTRAGQGSDDYIRGGNICAVGTRMGRFKSYKEVKWAGV